MLSILLIALTATACEKSEEANASPNATPVLPSRAPTVGDFPENAMLAYVPADTPYVFATFKPVPIEFLRQMTKLWGPGVNQQLASAPAPLQAKLRAVLDEIGDFDPAHLQQLGIDVKARWVVYGMGKYPVVRAEISDGDRLMQLGQRFSKKLGMTFSPPTDRAGFHTWLVDLGADWTFFLGIGSKQVVMAFAPRARLEASLPLVLGEKRPAKAITATQLKAVAERDGFTGYGVGYVDLAQVGVLIADAAGADAGCKGAVAELARRAPRFAFGYEDLTAKHLAFGMVVELAPDVLSDLRRISSPLAGFDRFLGERPMIGLAVAGSIERARDLMPRAGKALSELGSACGAPSVVEAGNKFADVATTPLPPMFSGLRGGYLVLDTFQMNQFTGTKIDGYAVVRADRTTELVRGLSSMLPGIDLRADGKPHALPAGLPMTGHAAVTGEALAVALGKSSESRVTDALRGKPVPAPLAVMRVDYSRMGAFMTSMGTGDPATLAMMQVFDLATMQLLVDDRGLVAWMSVDMR
jgi:hypothetical protein